MYEDEHTLVFMDIMPVTDGHTLVITKEHFENIFEASPVSLQGVAATAKKVAHAIRDVLQPAGMMVFQLNGAAAFQSVFHYHMHLMPRAEGEPITLHGRTMGNEERLEELAQQFAAAIR